MLMLEVPWNVEEVEFPLSSDPTNQPHLSLIAVHNLYDIFIAVGRIDLGAGQKDSDLLYIANVTVGGQVYPVQLDTGSSDLWVTVDKNAKINSTGLSYKISYNVGFAAGTIAIDPVEFAGFRVEKQAYLAADNVQNSVLQLGAKGVLGTSFTRLSGIDYAVNATGNSWGRSLLFNIFALNPNEPNFMAYSLQRNLDPDQDVEGLFTIGEYAPQYAGVAKTPPIPLFPDTNPARWTFLMDSIIANGQTIAVSSVVSGAPAGKAVALVDTGTSYNYAPPQIVQAIYSSVPGATFNTEQNQWEIPCSTEVDISIVIGGRQFNIHPLDVVQTDPNNPGSCFGAFLPQATSTATSSELDILLGAAFLRSCYSVFDFGDFLPGDSLEMGKPYIQLWSLVEDGAEASADFHQVRGGTANNTFLSNAGVNTPSNSTASASGSSSTSSGTSSANINSLEAKVDKIYKFAPALFALTAVNILVLLVVLILAASRFCTRRKRKTRSRGNAMPVPTSDPAEPSPEPGSFIPLQRPNAPGLSDYRPVSMGETLRGSMYNDSLKSPGYGPDRRYSDVPE
ncbi:aspartic peptidase domain-containing protein [Hysterangium stoloniferum]|nr:aspartic peptidase domain-containing protein [Hysterangium stoloniferum]